MPTKAEVPPQRQFVAWAVAAVLASGLLAGVLAWQSRSSRARWASFVVGDAPTGAALFRTKGCAACHAVNGAGARLAPDLGAAPGRQAGIGRLASAMWNHAPRMWEQLRTRTVPYPELGYEETAHLFAYLHAARSLDPPGDQARGRVLFEIKSCARCHLAADLARGVDSAGGWAKAMWNHAPAMKQGAARLRLQWPRFARGEMNDLLAYLRGFGGRAPGLSAGSPQRGWEVFQKACIACHSVRGKGGPRGGDIEGAVPLTPAEFAGLLWNHSPEMWPEPDAREVPRPVFHGEEIADLAAFLASLRYSEPAGSPEVGRTVFAERGCAGCHGAGGEGRSGPAVRGRGQAMTAITLGAALWEHGPKMYERARAAGRSWPTLADGDIGEIVAFLNEPAIDLH